MLALLTSGRGMTFIRRTRATAKNQFEPVLASGNLGGSRMHIDVTLLGPEDGYTLTQFVIDGGSQIPGGDTAPLERIRDQLRARSVRTGMSCADADLLGDTPLPNESDHTGNVVLDLTPDGTYKLIVSAGGLDAGGCELVCEYVAREILAFMPQLLTEPVAAPAFDYAEAEAA